MKPTLENQGSQVIGHPAQTRRHSGKELHVHVNRTTSLHRKLTELTKDARSRLTFLAITPRCTLVVLISLHSESEANSINPLLKLNLYYVLNFYLKLST